MTAKRHLANMGDSILIIVGLILLFWLSMASGFLTGPAVRRNIAVAVVIGAIIVSAIRKASLKSKLTNIGGCILVFVGGTGLWQLWEMLSFGALANPAASLALPLAVVGIGILVSAIRDVSLKKKLRNVLGFVLIFFSAMGLGGETTAMFSDGSGLVGLPVVTRSLTVPLAVALALLGVLVSAARDLSMGTVFITLGVFLLIWSTRQTSPVAALLCATACLVAGVVFLNSWRRSLASPTRRTAAVSDEAPKDDTIAPPT